MWTPRNFLNSWKEEITGAKSGVDVTSILSQQNKETPLTVLQNVIQYSHGTTQFDFSILLSSLLEVNNFY